MSRYVGEMVNDASGMTVRVYEGFSWPAFFFGPFWFAAKGMIGMFFVGVVLALATFGISWFILPFFANGQYRESLAKRGYRVKNDPIPEPVYRGS